MTIRGRRGLDSSFFDVFTMILAASSARKICISSLVFPSAFLLFSETASLRSKNRQQRLDQFPDLRVVLMSASVKSSQLTRYFECPLVRAARLPAPLCTRVASLRIGQTIESKTSNSWKLQSLQISTDVSSFWKISNCPER